jgi:hypothetical protein
MGTESFKDLRALLQEKMKAIGINYQDCFVVMHACLEFEKGLSTNYQSYSCKVHKICGVTIYNRTERTMSRENLNGDVKVPRESWA